jgi:hypothetical protein
MADDASETDVDESADADAEPETGKDWKAEAEKWQALARKNERQAKANAEAAAKLKDLEPLAKKAKELEDAGKSDLERLTSEAQGHLARADKAEGELMRLKVAVRKGLTETQAKRLVGSTEDELEEDADDLLASFKPAEPAKQEETVEEAEPERDPNPRRRPQERLRSGAVPEADGEPDETDPRKLAAMVPRKPFGI